METLGLKSILLDLDFYTKSFHVYAKKCDKFTGLAKWGDDIFPQLVLEKLVTSFPAETEIKMLGVGCGSGEMDSKMAASIKTRFKSVRNVVVDPAKKLLEMYRSLMERKSDEFQGIEFDLRQLGIDEYRSKEGDHPTKYHFISAIQSIYYSQDFNDTVRYLYDCLEEGGVMLITIISDISGFWRLWNRFDLLQESVGPYFCVNHVRQSLSSLSVPFDESRQRSRVDITSCFDKGSVDGEIIIDFLSQIIDLRGTASPEFYEEVVEFIGSDQCSERLGCGTILFNNDWDAVIAQKPQRL